MGNQGYPKLKGNASEGARWSEHVAKKGKYLHPQVSFGRFIVIPTKQVLFYFPVLVCPLREMRLALPG